MNFIQFKFFNFLIFLFNRFFKNIYFLIITNGVTSEHNPSVYSKELEKIYYIYLFNYYITDEIIPSVFYKGLEKNYSKCHCQSPTELFHWYISASKICLAHFLFVKPLGFFTNKNTDKKKLPITKITNYQWKVYW